MPARFSASPRRYPASSDTELFETPPRKRYRPVEEDSPSTSSSPLSPRKRQRRESPKKQVDLNLEELLRDCAQPDVDQLTIVRLKGVPTDEQAVRVLVKQLMHSAKAAVMARHKSSKTRLLETELYLEWLNELKYVMTGLDTALSAKIPGTRKRIPGLGRACYTILYNLVDEFIDEVNGHHDGSSTYFSSGPSLYPPTMTLVEEARDSSTDDRSEEAVELAEEALLNVDRVLADAARRYKAERGRSNPNLAKKISAHEQTLAKGCCLLCEQTGWAAEENDMGDTLMEETRGVMIQWRDEYEDCEDQLADDD